MAELTYQAAVEAIQAALTPMLNSPHACCLCADNSRGTPREGGSDYCKGHLFPTEREEAPTVCAVAGCVAPVVEGSVLCSIHLGRYATWRDAQPRQEAHSWYLLRWLYGLAIQAAPMLTSVRMDTTHSGHKQLQRACEALRALSLPASLKQYLEPLVDGRDSLIVAERELVRERLVALTSKTEHEILKELAVEEVVAARVELQTALNSTTGVGSAATAPGEGNTPLLLVSGTGGSPHREGLTIHGGTGGSPNVMAAPQVSGIQLNGDIDMNGRIKVNGVLLDDYVMTFVTKEEKQKYQLEGVSWTVDWALMSGAESVTITYGLKTFTLTRAGVAEQHKEATMADPKAETKGLMDRVKDAGKSIEEDANDAARRLAAKQFLKLTREPIVAYLGKQLGGDETMRQKIADFLDTELGEALLSMTLSLGLGMLPKGVGGPLPGLLTREFRVHAFTEVGDVVADLLLGPLRALLVSGILGDVAAPEAPPRGALEVSKRLKVEDVLTCADVTQTVGSL